MIVYLPALFFAAGLVVVYARAGRVRMAGTLAMVAAVGWALALLVGPGAAWWALGPMAGSLLLPRPPNRVPSTFEGLTRRALTGAGALVAALFVASRLPIGEHSLLLSAVPWFLAALGIAWFVSPIDHPERLQGQVLMVAAAGAVVLAALPAGPLTAAAAGALALVPPAGERRRVPGRLRPATTVGLLMLAAVSVAVAALGPAIARIFLFDLSFDLSGSLLLAVAILLVAGALATPMGLEWAALLAIVAVTASAPVLRWAALACLIAVATSLERAGERPAWVSVGLLAMTPVLQALAAPGWSARAQVVALGSGLVLMLVAARRGMLRTLVLPATAFLLVFALSAISAPNLARFQWLAAVGAVLLTGRALLLRLAGNAAERPIVRDQLILGLLLLGISARDPLGLGLAGAVLLLLDLTIVRVEEILRPASGWAARLVTLARSNWPPAVTFAGSALAVTAALQGALPLGLLAALLLAGLQLAPLVDRHALAPAPERPRTPLAWLGPVLSIACGLAPALVLRMLRV